MIDLENGEFFPTLRILLPSYQRQKSDNYCNANIFRGRTLLSHPELFTNHKLPPIKNVPTLVIRINFYFLGNFHFFLLNLNIQFFTPGAKVLNLTINILLVALF